ncbi:MAG TPA: hypothetical protein VFI02_13825 [Armatimonadota bacterium]|nr:hypothetical protein [Armatimonadota bacterium]
MGIPGQEGFGSLSPEEQSATIGQMSPEQVQAYGASLGAGIPEVTMPPQQPGQSRQPWQQGPYYDAMFDLEQKTGMPMGQAGPRQVPPMGRAEKAWERGMMQSPDGSRQASAGQVPGSFGQVNRLGNGGGVAPPQPQQPAPTSGYMPEGAAVGTQEAQLMGRIRDAQQTTQGAGQLLPIEAETEFANQMPQGQFGSIDVPVQGLVGSDPSGMGSQRHRLIPDGKGGLVPMPFSGGVIRKYTDEQRSEMAGRRARMKATEKAMTELTGGPRKKRQERAAEAAMMRRVRLGKQAPPGGMQNDALWRAAMGGDQNAQKMLMQRDNQNAIRGEAALGRQHDLDLQEKKAAADLDQILKRDEAEARRRNEPTTLEKATIEEAEKDRVLSDEDREKADFQAGVEFQAKDWGQQKSVIQSIVSADDPVAVAKKAGITKDVLQAMYDEDEGETSFLGGLAKWAGGTPAAFGGDPTFPGALPWRKGKTFYKRNREQRAAIKAALDRM